jgi:hypothetical protein
MTFAGCEIADSVRDISKWEESLIDSQINLICALLETALRMLRGGHTGADWYLGCCAGR